MFGKAWLVPGRLMVRALARETGVPLGINVLANAPVDAFAIAMAGGARFIRVNQWVNAYIANEGFMEGRAGVAMRYRSLLRAEHIKVFADSHVKHGAHAITVDRSIEELTRDLVFFDADAVIATGQRTGHSASGEEMERIARHASAAACRLRCQQGQYW